IARIRKTSPVDLGDRREPWVYWIELGQWLSSEAPSARLPLFAGADRGLGNFPDRTMAKGVARSAQTPALWLSVVIRTLTYGPDHPLPWLALGRELEAERSPREAR